MRRLILAALLFSSLLAVAQRENTYYANQFPGSTVGQMVTNAQTACISDTSVPCFIVLDPTLAKYATGVMPSPCANCFWEDYRTGLPFSAGSNPTNEVHSSSFGSVALALAATTAGHILVIDSNATMGTPITIPTGVWVRCAPGVTITKGFNGNLVQMGNNTALTDCTLDGVKASFTGATVFANGVTKYLVAGNTITNSGDAGISSYTSNEVTINRNKITGSTLSGILIHQGGANIYVSGNFVDCQGGTTDQSDCIGIYSETGAAGPANVSVIGNTMQNGVSDFCVEVGSFGGTTPPQNISIFGNLCTAAAGTNHGGFSIGDGATFVVVAGNTFAGNGFANDIAAFEIAGATTGTPTVNVNVSSNVAECYGPCVSISAKLQDVTVSSNEFRVLVNSSTAIKISDSTNGADENRVNITNNSILLNGTSDGIFAQCNTTGGNCADWVIKGNHINGSNPASNTGINVTQSAGTMQRITVEDNSVNNLSVGFLWNAPTVSRFLGNVSSNVGTHFSAASGPGATFTIDDITGITFAQLGSFNNGSRAYCSNCTIANPCASGGTGALAKRLNGVWLCQTKNCKK